ncbi:MAG: hypothetical protein ACE5EQ_00485, partial [Phycisphaerae bacterium]
RDWAEKYYWKEAGLPLATFQTIEEFWERPMLQPSYISASCTKCHQEIFDLERHRTERLPAANNIVEGRELFTRNGCINCHNINGLSDSRRVGIDLTYVADKLSAGFMERWIEYPNNFRPSTRMPHFFHQENNLASSANREFDPYPVLRTETEIKAITHYLRTFSRPFDAEPLPDGIQGDPKRGEQLFLSIGCLACHVDMDAHDPLDSAGRTFAEKWIVTDLTHVKARAAIDKQRRESQEPTIEDKLSVLDKVAEAAREDFNRMSKNDRTRYAFRRFTPDRREAALLAKKTEEFLAETQERDPDPFKIYVPPTFVRQGPELSGMGSKLVDDPNNPQQVDRGLRWLYNWLRDPRHYASNTIMPRMFRDNYYQTLPAEERRLKNDQDILDVSAYLIGLRHDTFKADPIPETPEHLAEMQRLILFLLGGQNTASVAEKILNDEVTDPAEPYGALTRAIVAQTYQSFGGGEAGRKKVAALIDARSGSLDERQKLYFGMKMIAHYGCFACHTIAGFEDTTRPGTDMSTWAQKFKSQLDFAFYSHVFHHEREENPEAYENLYRGSTPEDIAEYSHLIRDIAESPEDLLAHIDGQISSAGNVPQHILHNHASFAYHKMRNPRIWDREKYKKPYDKLKMPNFFLSEREARAVTTYLLSRRDPAITEHVRVDYKNTPIGKIARGRALVRRLNCIGCHTIEGGSEATIHQYYTADTNVDDNFPFGPRFKPPLLWGEGAKIQHDWLFGFLNNVEMLRPWLNVRMPSFYLSGEDATTLVEYFAGLAQDESGFLNEYLTPVEKHLKQVSAGQDGADANWFRLDKFKNTSEFLRRYALTHQQVGPYDFDTSQATDDAEKMETLADAFTKVTARGRFLADLFDVAFPFSDPESHTIDDARFKLGEAFFFDQKCLSCHVAGDPSVPGTTKDIKAPNFALTYKRLRYDWLYNWLQDPQAIQPGANMPQIFQGGTAHASLPEDARKEKEDLFGHTVDEQARLLLDFLVSLGERRYTAIQPGALEEAGKAAEEGESEFDFDADESDTEDQEEEFDFD